MRTPRRIAIATAVAACASGAGGSTTNAVAQGDCVAPPGRAGVEQYCESIPGAGREESARDPNRTPLADSRGLPENSRMTLREEGPDGEAVLRLPAGSDFVERPDGRLERAPGDASSGPGEAADEDEAETVRSTLGSAAADGGGGLSALAASVAAAGPGSLIPVGLLLAGAGVLAIRRRAGTDDSA